LLFHKLFLHFWVKTKTQNLYTYMRLLLTISFLCSFFISKAQLFNYNATGTNGTTNALAPQNLNNTNLRASILSRGNGVLASSATDRLASTDWTTLPTTTSNSDYYSFHIATNTGQRISLTNIQVVSDRNTNGVRNFVIRSSLDNFTSNLNLTALSLPATSVQTHNIPLTLNNLSTSFIEFRLYGFNATNCTGTWRISALTVSGSTNGFPDVVPPNIATISVVNPKKLEVRFSETVSRNDVSNVANFAINSGIGTPQSIELQNADSSFLVLNLQNPLILGQNYTLNINNVRDFSNNIATNLTQNFTYTDTRQPTLVRCLPVTNNGLDLYFSEDLNLASSQNSSNYSICNEPNIVGAVRDNTDKSLVHLLLAAAMTENSNRTITARNMTDLQNNANLETATNFIIDTRRPTVDSLLTPTNNRITLVFSEPIELISAELINNYNLDDLGLPQTIRLDNQDFTRVHLTFSSAMIQGKGYTLRVTRVTDLNGNQMTTRNIPFVYDKIPPTIQPIKISQNHRLLTLNFSEPLDPNVANALTNFELRQGTNLVPINTAWICDKTFTTIFLRPTTQLLDNQNFTLSVRNVRDRQNNVILPTILNFSTTNPTFAQLHVIDNRNLRVFFSEIISKSTAENLANYRLNNSINPTQAQRNAADSSIIELRFANSLIENQNYSLIINNLQDRSNNSIAANTQANFTVQNFIQAATVVSPRLLDVKFSKVVNLQTILDTANYLIDNNIGKPISLTRDTDDSTLVHLLLRNVLQPNVSYTLNVSGFALDCQEFLTASKFTFSEDRTLPTLQNVVATSAKDLVLTFSKNLDLATAEALNHYNIVGIGNPTQADLDNTNPKIVYLKLSANLQANITYILNAERVKDRLGNVMNSQSISFSRPLQPKPNELLITEIMPDPDPVRQLPNTEYIEIYNNSNQSFQLIGLKIKDATTETLLKDYVLQPDDYVLLVPNGRKNTFASSIQPKIMEVSPAISMTNSGEELQVLDQDNKLIFSLLYSDSWYRDAIKKNGGWSLEMLNPRSACLNRAANWTASQDTTGGTPTLKNSLWKQVIDTIAPSLQTVLVKNNRQIEVIFSEELDSLEAIKVANYLITNNITIASIEYLTANRIVLNTSNNLDSAVLYTLTASNIKDCAENQAITKMEFGIGTRARVNDLVICEIMVDETPRVGLPLAEYIELYNRSNRIINLGAVRLQDESGAALLPQKIIKPKEYLTLAGTTKADSLQALAVTGFPSLSNTGEKLILTDTSGYVIHSVTYTDTWYKNETKKQGGWSLEMIDTNNFCGEISNWTASTNLKGGTPNQKNSVSAANPDNESPKVANFSVLDSQNLDVTFNEKMNESSLVALANYAVSTETGQAVAIQKIVLKTDRQVQITLQNAVNNAITYKLTISNTRDCSGNILNTASFTFGLGRSPKKGELLITEIFADESPSVKLPLAEWIEVYNNSNDLLNLQGIKLSDESSTTTLANIVIQAKTYIVLCATSRVDSLAKVVNRSAVFGVTGFPSLANAGENLTLRNAQNEVLHSVTYSDTWYNDEIKRNGGWSLEMIDFNNLCSEGENWTASQDATGGSPAKVNSVLATNIDKIFPFLTEIKWISNTEIEVVFNEKMDSLVLTKKENFVLVPTQTIKSVLYRNEKTVRLQFDNSLNTNILYELQAKNMKDCAGNETLLTKLEFGRGTAPQKYELLITEIMADPSPVVQLPEREYIEIFNNSQKLLNLGNVKLQDEGGEVLLPNVVLKAQEYALLCSTTSVELFRKQFTNAKILGVVGFPAINNAGEYLALQVNNRIIFDVSFTDNWYQNEIKKLGGWALEMVDTNNPCGEAANWRVSTHASGGTPAQENSVKGNNLDKVLPFVEKISLENAANQQVVSVLFSEKLDSLTSLDIKNYTISPQIEVEKVSWADNKTVLLALKTPILTSIVYQIAVQRVKDCSGNMMLLQTLSFGSGESPNANDLIITELMPDPSPTVNLPESEYIEIYNPTNKIISLGDCRLSNGTSTAKLPFLPILPKTYILFVPTTVVETFKKLLPNANILGVSPWISLANEGDTIRLSNAKGSLIFDVAYQNIWYRDAEKAEGGWALEMIDVNFPCVQSTNWTASENKNGGTPAATNSVAKPNPDTQAPVLLRVDVLDSKTLRLEFNEKLDSIRSLSATYKVTTQNNSFVVQKVVFEISKNKQIILQLQNALQAKTTYNLSVFGVYDCSGNGMAATQNRGFVLPEVGEKGDLILNEVLFNPPVGGVDFVEIYNKSDKFIDLKGWALARKVNGLMEQIKIVSLQTLVISPKSYVVFSPNLTQLKNQYTKGVDSTFVETALPTYSDSEGTVVLLLPNGEVADLFDYNEDYHFKLLDNKDNVSLERIDFEVVTNDKNNWHSAASPQFGTPGYRNSQARGSAARQKSDCFWIENEIITPDGDGWQDFAFLRYACNQTGFVANATIYDGEGREIKTLLQSQVLGNEGQFRWDGDTNEGRKARIGYYIVHIQVFNLQGARAREDFQLKCVVGGKF
jgi:hypothetical protein